MKGRSSLTTKPIEKEKLQGRGLWQNAWLRLKKNSIAKVSLYMFLILIVLAVFPNLFTVHGLNDVDWDHIQAPPSWESRYWFGTDGNGRDLLVRTLYGLRISLLTGLLSVGVSLFIGVIYGSIAGYYGGRIDSVMMRIVDILYSLPFMFFVIILTVIFGRHYLLIFIAIGAVEWLTMARIVRGQTLTLKKKEFIQSCYVIGLTTPRIILVHIIPNLIGTVVVYATLTVPQIILLESLLSFLGLGVQEPLTSLGVLISEGVEVMEIAPWMLFFPSLLLLILLFCLNFIGDGLRDALDPKEY